VENYTSHIGFELKQRDNCEFKVFTFKEKVSKVKKFTTVTRQADEKENGYQRVLNKNKIKAILRYLNASPNNIIPNNIIIAIDKESNMNCRIVENSISFDFKENDESNLALIIDGQHRLSALNEFDMEEEVIVTVLVNISSIEQAIQFITINTKSQSASKVDLKSVLNSDYYKDMLSERLSNAGITNLKTSTILDYFHKSNNSPFKGYLDWQLTREEDNRIIQLNALEQIVKLCKNEIEEFNNDEDLIVFFLSVLWNELKNKFTNCWNVSISTKNKDSNFLKKSTIIGVTEYFLLEAVAADDYSDFFKLNDISEESIKTLLTKNLFLLVDEFWYAEWKKGLDTSAGRAVLRSSIKKAIDNIKKGKDWSEKLELIKYS
jgi:DGQHR domain-containing protein